MSRICRDFNDKYQVRTMYNKARLLSQVFNDGMLKKMKEKKCGEFLYEFRKEK